MLRGISPLFVLDEYVAHPLVMMAAIEGDQLDPQVERSYRAAIDLHWPKTPTIDRFALYEQAKTAFAVLMTGETAKYGNFTLKKGLTPFES
jgi:L-fucose mutarotase